MHRRQEAPEIPSFTLRLALLLAATLALSAPASAGAGLRVELEGAVAWQTRNDFAVPGGAGTRVELTRPASDPVLAGRVAVALGLSEEWWVRGLAAPMRTVTRFVPGRPVAFQDAIFAPGSPVEVEYVFDSYRASLYRRWGAGRPAELRLGLTAKVRDAKIALASGTLVREETDLGFVPLLYAGVTLSATSDLSLDLEADALGAPQGYAVDATVRAMRALGNRLQAFAGYRVLDGGADVDRVYSFATFHYATAGIVVRL